MSGPHERIVSSPDVRKRYRLILNYKKIPYRTEWISISDIKETHLKLGIAPTGKVPMTGEDRYTLPAIAIPDSNPEKPYTYVVDSPVIAEYLDRTFPSPAIFPNGSRALIALFQNHLISSTPPSIYAHYFGLLIKPSVPKIMESTKSYEYFVKTRQALYRVKDLGEVCPRGEGRVQVWKKMKREFDLLDGWMSREEGAGEFVMGETPSYADFILGGMFMMMKAIPSGPERDGEEFDTMWDVMKDWHGARWKRLMDGLAPYVDQK